MGLLGGRAEGIKDQSECHRKSKEKGIFAGEKLIQIIETGIKSHGSVVITFS